MGQAALLEAIKKNDTTSFDKILAAGYNVNKRKTTITTRYGFSRKRKGRNGKTYIDKSARKGIPLVFIKRTDLPLTEAAFNENYYFVSELLKHGAKPNKKKNTVLHPLGWAAHRGNMEIVKILLDHGADINGSERKWRTTPLIEAIQWKHWEIAKFLIDKGANTSLADEDGKTALSHAAIHKNLEIAKALVEKGADVNHSDKRGEFVLEDACSDHHLFAETNTAESLIRYLVENGASINNRAINKVLAKGETGIAKYLLDKGAPASNRLVIDAANGKNLELLKYLVDTLGLNSGYYDTSGYSGGNALHQACRGYWGDSSIRHINIEMIRYLVGKGLNVNQANKQGQTPLNLVVEYGKKDSDTRVAAEILIKNGADVNIAGGDMHFSPLMHTASQGLLETAKLLIEYGADVNYTEKEGRTVLHWASWTYNNMEMIKLLVHNGADINAKESRDGETPIMDCVVFGRTENIKMLAELGADLNIKSKNGYTLLDAISDDNLRQFLISMGAKSGKEQ